MSLTLALAFAPQYAALPPYLAALSAVPISPRFPRAGGTTNGMVIGTNGTSTTHTPVRSVIEAQQWGATVAEWCYTDLAASYGYASPAALVSEFSAAGIPIQGTTNTRAANPSTGAFMQDAGGSNWSAGSNPDRPLVGGLAQSPAKSRIGITIDYMPAADAAGTQAPKLASIATQMAAGCFGLHMDDPRGGAAYSGWRGITSPYDITSQGCDFSPTARAGFTAWLSANTTAAERTAVGLPSSLAGFDILAWLTTNRASLMFTPGQDNPAAVDNYRFRIGISADESLRTILLRWLNRFLRDDHAAYVQQVRLQLAGAPLSLNFWSASPTEYLSWHTRRAPRLFDFAVAETAPPYWSEVSGNTVGSPAFHAAREAQNARQHLNATTCDAVGLRAFFEHKPTSLTDAPARVVVQMMRQSIMQTVMEGASPVVPIDVFMTTSDDLSQGVSVDGYRYWGSVADYGNCFAFIRANAPSLDGYVKLATVHLLAHSDSWPFHSGSQATRFGSLMQRLAELWRRDVDYHWLMVGAADGLLPADPPRGVETTAPLIIRVQDDTDYYAHLGRMGAPNARRWSTAAAAEAMEYSPVRSLSPWVRATARYNPTAGRVSVHLHNYRMNSDGTPRPETTVVRWNRAFGTPGVASVTRLGEAPGTVDLSRGFGQVTLREYAILNFAVA